MSQLIVPKKTPVYSEEDLAFGVCVWQLPNGNFVMDDQGNYFSAQGKPFDKNIERKMEDAVHNGLNIREGRPAWLPGSRKVSDSEWELQMELFQDGASSPDPADIYRQLGGK